MTKRSDNQAPAPAPSIDSSAGPADLQAPGEPAPAVLGSAAGPEDLQVTLADGSTLADDELAVLGQRRRATCLESGVWQAGVWTPVYRHYTDARRDELDSIRERLAAECQARYGADSDVRTYPVDVDLRQLLGMIDGSAKIPECIKRVSE